MPRPPSGSLPGPRQINGRQVSRDAHSAERRPGKSVSPMPAGAGFQQQAQKKKVVEFHGGSPEDEMRFQHLQQVTEENSRQIEMQKEENNFLKTRIQALLKEKHK